MNYVKNFILNWLRGFAYIADGLIMLLSFGFVEPDFSIMTDDWFVKRLEKSLKKGELR